MSEKHFIEGWYDLQELCAEINSRVWGPYSGIPDENDKKSRKLLQMVGEIIEAQDALRVGNPPSEKIPSFTSEEEELADVVLRLMDYAEANNLRIPEAMIAKADFNSTRPFRHGGKLF